MVAEEEKEVRLRTLFIGTYRPNADDGMIQFSVGAILQLHCGPSRFMPLQDAGNLQVYCRLSPQCHPVVQTRMMA
jgi:hypothetical protein